jgi:hypothetical protein
MNPQTLRPGEANALTEIRARVVRKQADILIAWAEQQVTA